MKKIEIRIANLYYDLMNLYGENGNVRAFKEFFNKQGIDAHVDNLTVNDKIDFNSYDIFYMGTGTELNSFIVLNDLTKRKNELKDAIENNKYFFFTGNSFELLGKYIINTDGKKIDALNIFDYYTSLNANNGLNNASAFRIVGEIVGKSNLIKNPIIGFQNKLGTVYENNNPLFTLTHGIGNNLETNDEGFNYKNFYGTHIIGPIFIRNPYLTNYFVKEIIKEKKKDFKIKTISSSNEVIAYKKYLENFKDLIND